MGSNIDGGEERRILEGGTIMKIGVFAKQNQVSIDTIRHYMNLELLMPQKVNKQFDFDLHSQNDLNEIIYLKSLGFSLLAIKNIFIVKHLGQMTPFQQDDYYKDIFKGKLKSIEVEMEKINLEKYHLKEEIHRLDSSNDLEHFEMGIDLNCLQLLKCNNCGKLMVLKEAVVDNNMVMYGKLKCKCGSEYTIQDGIIYIDPYDHNRNQIPDIVSYIQHTDEEYLNQVYKTLEWNYANINFNDLESSIILELGSGSGFFLRRIYEELPESAIYIAVDYDIERMRLLKGILEKAKKKKNILFICCDFNKIPLHNHSVDVICDYAGTSNYCFDHKEFLLKILEKYFKTGATLLGSYLIFKNFSTDSTIPFDCHDNFRMDSVKQQIESLGFSAKSEYVSDIVTKGGIYESYFKSNEKVLTYCFIGKRLG